MAITPQTPMPHPQTVQAQSAQPPSYVAPANGMAEHQNVQSGPPNDVQAPRRRRTGKRSLPRPSPAYFVFQVLDEHGTPMPIPKSRIKVLACERNTDKVLELIDGGEHDHVIYIRGMLAPARNFGPTAQAASTTA